MLQGFDLNMLVQRPFFEAMAIMIDGEEKNIRKEKEKSAGYFLSLSSTYKPSAVQWEFYMVLLLRKTLVHHAMLSLSNS